MIVWVNNSIESGALKIPDSQLRGDMSKLRLAVATATLIGSLTALAAIEGTYVLSDDQDDNRRFNKKETTLAINVDDEGQYLATLTSSFGAITKTNDIEVTEDGFAATFVLSTSQDELEVTYEGEVKDGNLSGTITSRIGEEGDEIEVKLTGKLKEEKDPKSDKEIVEEE